MKYIITIRRINEKIILFKRNNLKKKDVNTITKHKKTKSFVNTLTKLDKIKSLMYSKINRSEENDK